jgi:hypothetical protein
MYIRTVRANQGLRHPRLFSTPLGNIPPGSLPGFTPAEEKALRITSTFETGKVLGFGGLTGNFDGQGLSFGLLQWNIGTGGLQPLLQEFARNHPQRFQAVFGPDAPRLRQILGQAHEEQLRFARSINDSHNRIIEPWKSYFQRLENEPEFQKIQLRSARKRMNRAIQHARNFGLRSERGLALMFDQVTQSGGAWLTCTYKPVCKRRARLIEERRGALQQTLGRPLTEHQLLEIIAHVVADTTSPKYQEKVRARKMTIVKGSGRVHGQNFDLARDFGLTDQPWETTAANIPIPTSSSTSAPAGQAADGSIPGSLFQKLQRALRSGQWYVALGLAVLSGNRDANKLTDMIFFAQHLERRDKKLLRGDPLTREWLNIRDRLVQPFLKQAPPAGPLPSQFQSPQTAGLHPEVNTLMPNVGLGLRSVKSVNCRYGVPETIQALQAIGAAWHRM